MPWVDSCLKRSEFDYDAYISACSNLAVVWYVWQPPGQTAPQAERLITPQELLKRRDKKRLAMLFNWADRTDPGAKARTAATMRLWEARTPGTKIIYTSKVRSAL